MKKEEPIKILIDWSKLQNSKYSDVNILQYTPAEKHPENKCIAIVDFCERKIIYGDTDEDISRIINSVLEKKKGL
ncbi:hypothetical protein [uncultured Thomasclavelia sp.]|uniref:hypothetical protein n=1 Tax=uncultured Thomasclavelia sp. TaxID=3025759 RepID=UPI002591A9AE|nr:hypothetical protein [uncultured Thomasclavelia sp.]